MSSKTQSASLMSDTHLDLIVGQVRLIPDRLRQVHHFGLDGVEEKCGVASDGAWSAAREPWSRSRVRSRGGGAAVLQLDQTVLQGRHDSLCVGI
jgi:hypothetical protein